MNTNDMIDLCNARKPGHLINIKTKAVKGHLVFVIQEMTWNAKRDDNDYGKRIDMMPNAFAVWYAAKDAEGWRVMS